jgi:hypothetical protein
VCDAPPWSARTSASASPRTCLLLRGVDGTRLDVGNGAVAWRVVQCRTLIDLGYHKARRRSLFARSSCSDELLSALSTHSHSFILLDMTTVPALITGRPTPYPSVRWLGTAMMRPRRVSWRSERSRRLHRTWYARPIPTPDTRDSQIEITQFLPTTIKSISTHHPSFSLSLSIR